MTIHSFLSLVIYAIIILSLDGYISRLNTIKYNKINYHIKLFNNIINTNHHNKNHNNNKYYHSKTSLFDNSNNINMHESLQQPSLKASTNNNYYKKIIQSIATQFKIIWDFTRPHTIVGSMLSIVGLYLYAIPPTYWKESLFIQSLLKSLIPSLLMNLYITGNYYSVKSVFHIFICMYIVYMYIYIYLYL